ncbi:unnamed protein product [Cylindrotheca closterium]|uniref:Uncharacterized protein n=1 Tax=Cylindrotheca closterium TaxID=2856 RepID=A0AAD2G786_9STRA|nr:unnamed protein product [Cylindrotheca closterium]
MVAHKGHQESSSVALGKVSKVFSTPSSQDPTKTIPAAGAIQTKDHVSTRISQSTLSQAEEAAIEAARKAAYEKYGVAKEPLLNDMAPFTNFSHIRYGAHSGLGHRLVRQASAVYLGRLIGFGVRGYWSNNEYSNHTKDIFSEMFEPFQRKDFFFVNSTNRTIKFGNEVDHMTSPYQMCGSSRQTGHCKQTNTKGKEGPKCGCTFDEIQVHTDFYRSLRDRYVRRQLLADFMEKHKYSEHTVFGIHIRAGNGEQKDFTYKKRGIHHDTEEYVAALIKVMRETIPMDTLEKPPMIFLATDDPKYRTIIANEIQELGLNWPVVVLEQEFAEEGVVLHGGNKVYEKWFSMFQDMLLLSHSDVLIAVKYSSFTQAIPMYLVLDRPESERKLRDNYCELIDENEFARKNGTGPELSLYCYHSYMQNCCGTDNMVQRKVTKFLQPQLRGADLNLKITDFTNRQYLSFEDSLGRF